MPLETKVLYSYQKKVFGLIEEKINYSSNTQVIYLEGGHFDPRIGATEFSVNSLQGTIDLANNLIKKFGRKIKIVFGILVDDLGMDCSDDLCEVSSFALGNSLALPKRLEKILDESVIIKKERVFVTSERNAKNRSINFLKRIIDTETQTNQIDLPVIINYAKDESGCVVYESDSYQPITLATFKGKVWAAKCPAIMSIHYRDVFKHLRNRFYDQQYDFTIIDISEVVDRNKVSMGAEVYLRLVQDDIPEQTNSIINVFFCDSEGSIFFIDEKSLEDYVESKWE